MERKEVIVSEQELARQKEFTRKMREMNDRRTRTPLALVDTFGCQQNVADGEVLMGMLREMGYEYFKSDALRHLIYDGQQEAVRLGLTDGYMQEKSSAREEYTPPFDLEGV